MNAKNSLIKFPSENQDIHIQNTMFNWRVIISNQKSKLEKLFMWKSERETEMEGIASRKTPSMGKKERKKCCRTLWHFNNLISNYIIKIYIWTGISNAMDITENVYVYWLFRDASEIYDSVSIILIESINQPRTARRQSKWKIHWQFFGSRLLTIVMCLARDQRSSSDELNSENYVQASSPSRFLINNFFRQLFPRDCIETERKTSETIWLHKTSESNDGASCVLSALIKLILMTESERQMKSSSCIWLA